MTNEQVLIINQLYSSHPVSRPYILQTTFPVKELQDNNQSIKEAGLLNSVIVQRYQ